MIPLGAKGESLSSIAPTAAKFPALSEIPYETGKVGPPGAAYLSALQATPAWWGAGLGGAGCGEAGYFGGLE
jgi:hypothetical protein